MKTYKGKKEQPTKSDIQELLSFLPIFSLQGFKPIIYWHGTEESTNGILHLSFPEYDSNVIKFFHLASKECWCDYQYNSSNAYTMIQNKNLIDNASLSELKSLLTHCVRGERFCDGHWGEMIESGIVQRCLNRLKVLFDSDFIDFKIM